MIEPRKWNSWKDIALKLGSLAVSMKYHVAVFACIALIGGTLTAVEWVVFMGALLGIREVGNVLNRRTEAAVTNGVHNGDSETE